MLDGEIEHIARYSLQGILVLQSLQVASIIFLDAPVGTGFSYANNWESYVVVDDHLSATDTYNFLIKVSIRFHQHFILKSLVLSIFVVNNVYFTPRLDGITVVSSSINKSTQWHVCHT